VGRSANLFNSRRHHHRHRTRLSKAEAPHKARPCALALYLGAWSRPVPATPHLLRLRLLLCLYLLHSRPKCPRRLNRRRRTLCSRTRYKAKARCPRRGHPDCPRHPRARARNLWTANASGIVTGNVIGNVSVSVCRPCPRCLLPRLPRHNRRRLLCPDPRCHRHMRMLLIDCRWRLHRPHHRRHCRHLRKDRDQDRRSHLRASRSSLVKVAHERSADYLNWRFSLCSSSAESTLTYSYYSTRICVFLLVFLSSLFFSLFSPLVAFPPPFAGRL